MSAIELKKDESQIRGRFPRKGAVNGGIPLFNFPVTERENFERMYRREGIWMPYGVESGAFCPKIIPDNVARGFVVEANKIPQEEFGGKDMFGVDWVYVPVAGGSMEKPGDPHFFDDANDWKEKITFPNIDDWDWDQSARDNEEYLKNGMANMVWFLNGAGFERLISFMGFEDAAVALIDEEQEDALKDLLQHLTDLYIKLVDRFCEAYGNGISGFTYHDDWGSQKAPFFSQEAARKFFVPGMRELTDHIKSKGLIADLHSCGHIERQIENIIAGGWQSWTPMAMNDTKKLYREYGDQIIIAVCDDVLPEGADEKAQCAQAERFVAENYSTKKPSIYSHHNLKNLTDSYATALYLAGRRA